MTCATEKDNNFENLPKMNCILVLNHRCNLACSYCYGGEKFNRKMPEEVGKKAIDYSLKMAGGRYQLSFFGGEPMLEYDLILKFAEYGRQKAEEAGLHPRFQMTTNGTLLTPEKIEQLAKNKISVAISIDGDRQAHDANRFYPGGRSTFDDVENGLKEALKVWPWMPTMSVLDPNNIERWPQSFEYLYDLGCRRPHFSINYATQWSDADLELFSRKAEEVADKWLEKIRQNVDVRISYFDNKIITHLKDGLSNCDHCKFGQGEIAVAPSGNFYPCDRLVGEDNLEKYMIGNVEKGLEISKVLALKKFQKAPPEACTDCSYKTRCVNYCGCVNHALSGSHDEVSGEICHFEQTAIEQADRVAEILYKEQNQIFMERFYHSMQRRNQRLASE